MKTKKENAKRRKSNVTKDKKFRSQFREQSSGRTPRTRKSTSVSSTKIGGGSILSKIVTRVRRIMQK